MKYRITILDVDSGKVKTHIPVAGGKDISEIVAVKYYQDLCAKNGLRFFDNSQLEVQAKSDFGGELRWFGIM